MITKEKARKILGNKYKNICDENLMEIIGLMLTLAKIEYLNKKI
jgi:hypothetical protein